MKKTCILAFVLVAAASYLSAQQLPRTLAEVPLYPGAAAETLVPGSLVFRMTAGPVDLREFRNWWAWTPGACWRRPEGPGSSIRCCAVTTPSGK